MKLTKYVVSSAAAIAMAGTLSLAYAQTTTPGTTGSSNAATTLPQQQGAGTMSNGTTNSATRSGTAGTDTMNSRGTNLNADGTMMTTERVARADRG